jgi:spore maturation protein CgeB
MGRMSRVADTPLGLFGPLRRHRRPAAIRAVTTPPVFGMAYYELLGRAKIVLNAAVDISGLDRGNMRCWEALGAGALMVSDAGRYPHGMADRETIRTYQSASEAGDLVTEMLTHDEERQRIALAGHRMVRTEYSKAKQWMALKALAQ